MNKKAITFAMVLLGVAFVAAWALHGLSSAPQTAGYAERGVGHDAEGSQGLAGSELGDDEQGQDQVAGHRIVDTEQPRQGAFGRIEAEIERLQADRQGKAGAGDSVVLDVSDGVSVADAIEAANSTGRRVDLGGLVWVVDRSLYLSRSPRFFNGTLVFHEPGGIYLTGPNEPVHHERVELVDLTILRSKGIWCRSNHTFDRLLIDNLTMRDCWAGVQIDGEFLEGGTVRGFVGVGFHHADRKSHGLLFGYNNTEARDSDLPAIVIDHPYIDGVRTDTDAECHAIGTFAQPIHLTGGYIADVFGARGKAAEGVYTKTSNNIIRGVFLRNAGNGEGVIAIKASQTTGNIVEDCVILREQGNSTPDCAVWVQTSDSIFRRIVIVGYEKVKFGHYYQTTSSQGNTIEGSTRE